ncbi:MAG: transcription antitermination factor NusB [Flavobacteriales bacterium]
MLNRRHFRTKVLQVLYATFQDDNKDYVAGEKELRLSTEKIYDLYVLYLQIFSELRYQAMLRIEENKLKRIPTQEDLNPNMRFVQNPIVELLSQNVFLKSEAERRKITWIGDAKQDLIKKLFFSLREGEIYQNYMEKREGTFEEDRDFLVEIFKNDIANFELIHSMLEEQSIYWVDDIDVVCSMVIKTLKSYKSTDDSNVKLILLYKDEDEKEFVFKLYKKTVQREEEITALIKSKLTNWELDRIASMDMLLMKMAVTEAIEFNSIPVKVTLNEYIEIAKFYSTPKSSKFINGIIDKIFAELQKNGTIKKMGRGLINN